MLDGILCIWGLSRRRRQGVFPSVIFHIRWFKQVWAVCYCPLDSLLAKSKSVHPTLSSLYLVEVEDREWRIAARQLGNHDLARCSLGQIMNEKPGGEGVGVGGVYSALKWKEPHEYVLLCTYLCINLLSAPHIHRFGQSWGATYDISQRRDGAKGATSPSSCKWGLNLVEWMELLSFNKMRCSYLKENRDGTYRLSYWCMISVHNSN